MNYRKLAHELRNPLRLCKHARTSEMQDQRQNLYN